MNNVSGMDTKKLSHVHRQGQNVGGERARDRLLRRMVGVHNQIQIRHFYILDGALAGPKFTPRVVARKSFHSAPVTPWPPMLL